MRGSLLCYEYAFANQGFAGLAYLVGWSRLVVVKFRRIAAWLGLSANDVSRFFFTHLSIYYSWFAERACNRNVEHLCIERNLQVRMLCI